MKSLRVAAMAAVCFAALSTYASAATTATPVWWGGYHWKNGQSRTIQINTAVSGEWTRDPAAGGENYIQGAFDDWDEQATGGKSPLDLTGPVVSAANPKTCKAIPDQVLVCNAKYGFTGWLGIASVWPDAEKHITKATTKLNDSYFASGKYNTPAWRRLVSCQEVGHDFGLGHQNEVFDNENVGSCMDYTNAPAGGIVGGFNYGPSNERPHISDWDLLKSRIYGANENHATTTNFAVRTLGQSGRSLPAAAADADIPGDGPAQWGRAIHFDAKGRPDVFERDVGGGVRKVTHVFWTLETKRTDIHED
jgi:hypothetical protein